MRLCVGACGQLNCLCVWAFVCLCGYPCRGVLNTPYRAPPSVANTRPRVLIIHPLRDVWWAYAIRPYPGTCIRYGHSGPGARLGGVCRCAPGFRRPGFRPGLWSGGPTARPGTSHSGLAARLGGVCDTPLHGYMHSGPFGYPAKFAGVRRRPPLHGYVHSGPFGYPASFAGVRRRPEASETLKQLVWAFPRPRIP